MPVRLKTLPAAEFAVISGRIDEGGADKEDLRAATKHLLAVLVEKAPGTSVEVRVPPFAATQCIAGARHTRGTPPAVVEMDANTWVAVARGKTSWSEAARDGRISASGERSDLSPLLPLV